MILQALNEYYERLAGEEGSEIPLRGFSRQPVLFALEIDAAGTLRQVLDLRDDSKKRAPAQLVLPEPLKTPGSGFSANFLWDNTGYVLGVDAKDKPDRAAKSFQAFRERMVEVAGQLDDAGLKAVQAFLDAWSPAMAPELEGWKDMAGRNLVFRLAGEKRFVHERPDVRQAWLTYYETTVAEDVGQCLVTGKPGPIALTHTSIKGVWGAQSSGAAIVSFNQRSFESYGKDLQQGLNAPVSEEAAFNYTTALNDLLKSGSRQRVQIGDATTVFWTGRKTESEGFLGLVFSQKEDQGDLGDLRLFLQAAREGKMPDRLKSEGDARFYVLGLSPNAGRLSVRFWHVDTVAGMWRKLGQHFDDLRMAKTYDNEPDFPPMWLLLKATAKREDLDNLSPLLSGAFMRAILTGGAYPGGLLAAVIGRIRAEQKITYARAALIKACLARNARLGGKPLEVSVSLDEQNTTPAYLLGRLFAVLEKVQQAAHGSGKINRTIMDSFFSSASTVPMRVFPYLVNTLLPAHLRKIASEKRGLAHYFKGNVAKLLDPILASDGFPPHLDIKGQGLFSLGYYHQFNAKKPALETAAPETEAKTPTED